MEQAELVHQYPTRITEYSAIPNFQLNIPSNQKVQTIFLLNSINNASYPQPNRSVGFTHEKTTAQSIFIRTQIKTSSENPKSGFSDDLSLLYTTYFLFFSSLNALPTTNRELRLMPNAAIQGLT